MSAAIRWDAPYRDVDHAISKAYTEEARDVLRVAPFARMRGGAVRGPAELSPHERLAQAAYVMAFLREHLRGAHRLAVDARYTVPEGWLAHTKENDCRMLSWWLWDSGDHEVDRWYLCDITRQWAGVRRELTDEQWADCLDKTPRTLRHWRNGNRQRGTRGIVWALDGLIDEARHRLRAPMFDAGLIRFG